MSTSGAAKARTQRISPATARDLRNGLLFASPWLIGFSLFVLFPILASFYYSFTIYSIGKPPRLVGLYNYVKLFEDDLFWTSLFNTLYYVAFFMPIGTIWALAAAFLLNVKVKGIIGFRTLFYMPTIVPLVAASVVWMWVFNPQYGLLNGFLGLFGLQGGSWLNSPTLAKPALIAMSVWSVGSAMIIYLAALQDVPTELYEAAEIDGASAWSKVLNIALPMISPAILFNVIIGLIGAFQYFTQAYVMTQGGPMNATLFYALYLYRNAFQYFKMGYAAAMAWILLVLVLVTTLFVFRSSARWIYYRTEQ